MQTLLWGIQEVLDDGLSLHPQHPHQNRAQWPIPVTPELGEQGQADSWGSLTSSSQINGLLIK